MGGEVVQVRRIDLRALRALPAIPSGFQTVRTFRLIRSDTASGIEWCLHEHELDTAFSKVYDRGDVDEMLSSYEGTTERRDLRFAVAEMRGRAVGSMTWQRLAWNNTLWLLDIRARPTALRMGVGSALMTHLKTVAEEERVRGIAVETQINNYPAVRFYQRHGFDIAGFNERLYTNDDLEDQDAALFLFWRA